MKRIEDKEKRFCRCSCCCCCCFPNRMTIKYHQYGIDFNFVESYDRILEYYTLPPSKMRKNNFIFIHSLILHHSTSGDILDCLFFIFNFQAKYTDFAPMKQSNDHHHHHHGSPMVRYQSQNTTYFFYILNICCPCWIVFVLFSGDTKHTHTHPCVITSHWIDSVHFFFLLLQINFRLHHDDLLDFFFSSEPEPSQSLSLLLTDFNLQ